MSASKPYTDEQRVAAFEVMRKHGLWWESLLPFRNALITGDLAAARAFATDGLTLDDHDIDLLLAYFNPAVCGKNVRIVETTIEEVISAESLEQEESGPKDPLEWQTQYMVRVGFEVGRAFLMKSAPGAGFSFFFNGNYLDSQLVSQIWRIERQPEPK